MTGCARAAAVIMIAAGAAAWGCSPPAARTTFLRSVDLVDMTDRMAESFAADAVLGRRTPGSAPWVVSIDRAVNHTNQVMPSREKWLYVARLRALLAGSDLAGSRNIVWVVPPERWPTFRGDHPHDVAMPCDVRFGEQRPQPRGVKPFLAGGDDLVGVVDDPVDGDDPGLAVGGSPADDGVAGERLGHAVGHVHQVDAAQECRPDLGRRAPDANAHQQHGDDDRRRSIQSHWNFTSYVFSHTIAPAPRSGPVSASRSCTSW